MTDGESSTSGGQSSCKHPTTKTTTRNGHCGNNNHAMRKVVGKLVTNMEHVVKDIQGIMGDIKTLVVQIDSVTDKIDAHCSKHGKEKHVVRKPEMIDCQTYWSRSHTKTSCQDHNEGSKPYSTSTQGYEIPVFPASISPTRFLANHRLDNPNKLSNVERWLIQENARHHERFLQHSSIRYGGSRKHRKSVKFSDKQNTYHYKKGPLHTEEMNSSSVITSLPQHIIRQPCVHGWHDRRGVTFQHGEKECSRVEAGAHCNPETEYSNIAYDEIVTDRISSQTVVTNPTSVYFMSEQITEKRSVQKQIRVYNSHYKEDTSNTDESPGESEKNHTNLPEPPVNEFNVVVPTVLHSIAENSQSTNYQYEQMAALPESVPAITKQSAFSPKPCARITKNSPRPSSRAHQSSDSESHKYQSLESDLDSINDCNDPRCLTPDMDWSYLSLMGNGSNKILDKSSKHVYQTIGSPVFQRRKSKGVINLAKSISFDSRPEVSSQLISVENTNFVTETPDTERNCLNTFNTNIPQDLEELNESIILRHVYCVEVTDPYSMDYCGHYEAIVDAVLENMSCYSSSENTSISMGNRSDTVGETYVCFDDDIFDDEWDAGLKPSSDYYFEDDIIEFSLPLIPHCRIDTLDVDTLIETQTFSNSSETSEAHNVSNTYIQNMSSSSSLSPRNSNKKTTPHGNGMLLFSGYQESIEYDDLNTHNETHSAKLVENCVAPQVYRTNVESRLSFWDVSDREVVRDCGSPSTCSEEGSVEPMTSGSSNMSFGSVDVAITGSESEEHTSAETGSSDRRALSKTSSIEKLDEAAQETSARCEPTPYTVEEISSTGIPPQKNLLRKSSITTECEIDASLGASVDGTVAYNRNVNTWTAYAMVHVPADEISDSASDIINDNSVNNSINNSLTSSYFEADNNAAAVAQVNQSLLESQ